MTQQNFIKDAEEQAELGFGPRAVDFLVRLDPKEAKPADAVVKQLVEDWNENFLLEVAADAEKLRLKLDEAGVDLLVHAVARCVKPGTRELELFLQHDIVTLSLQDSKGNCALHYLAWNGVDLLGQLPIRRLLIRNLNGATPLHLQAKKRVGAERILALPVEILKLKTKRGATIESALESQPHEPILQEVAQARVSGEHAHITLEDLGNIDKIQCGTHALSLTHAMRTLGTTFSVNFIVEDVKDKDLFIKVSKTGSQKPGEDIYAVSVDLQRLEHNGLKKNLGSFELAHPMSLPAFKIGVAKLIDSNIHKAPNRSKVESRVSGEDKGSFSSPDEIPSPITIDGRDFVQRGSREIGSVIQLTFIDQRTLHDQRPTFFEISRDRKLDSFIVSVVSEKRRAQAVFKTDSITYKTLRQTVSDLIEANHVQAVKSKPVVGRVASEQQVIDWKEFQHLNSFEVEGVDFKLMSANSFASTFVGKVPYNNANAGKGHVEVKAVARHWGGPSDFVLEINISTWVAERVITIQLPTSMSKLQKALRDKVKGLVDDHLDSMFVIARSAHENENLTIEELAEIKEIKAGALTFIMQGVAHSGIDNVHSITYVTKTKLGDLFVYFNRSGDGISLHGAMSKAITQYSKIHVDNNLKSIKAALLELSSDLMTNQRARL